MATDDVRIRLRRRLAEEYGMDEADLLLDRPPGGWDDLVTKEWLHLELAAFRAEIDARFDGIDARFEGIEARFDGIDARFEGIEARFTGVDGQFVGINARLSSLEQGVAQIHSRLDQLSRDLHAQTWRLVAVLMTGMSIAIGAASAIAVVS